MLGLHPAVKDDEVAHHRADAVHDSLVPRLVARERAVDLLDAGIGVVAAIWKAVSRTMSL